MERPINIWILNHYAVAPGGSGGTRHYDLGKELVNNGYDVTIFASSFNHQNKQELFTEDRSFKVREKLYNGVKFVWIKTMAYHKNNWRRVGNMFGYAWSVYREGRRRQDQPDVIVGSLMHPLAALVGYFLARKKKCKFYFEERDLWPQSLIDLGKVSEQHPVVWILSKLELFLYKKSERVIVLFDKAVDYVAGRGIDRNQVLYISNGVDLERFAKPRESLPAELEMTLQKLKGKCIAIYIGSHGVSDYLEGMLEAAKVLKENDKIHFLFVGEGPIKQDLISLKEKEGLDNVTFENPIPKESIPALLSHADVGLMSLRNARIYKWGISFNKMYDYMAASLPILLLSEIRERTIENSGGGIIVERPIDLAEVLRELSEDQDRITEIGRRARLCVEQYFSWKNLATIFDKAIKEDICGK